MHKYTQITLKSPQNQTMRTQICAASRSVALKMANHFAHENPHIHAVGIQPGIIATSVNPNRDM